jgi:hypothetical protein
MAVLSTVRQPIHRSRSQRWLRSPLLSIPTCQSPSGTTIIVVPLRSHFCSHSFHHGMPCDCTDVEKRPQLVANALVGLGAEKVLERVGLAPTKDDATKFITAVSSMSTVAGVLEKKAELTELAAPYLAKARSGADGRKELAEELASTQLVKDGKTILDEKVIKPLEAKYIAGKEFAAPYVSSVKESSAPYVAKLEELRRSERVEAMITAFNAAREHPAEKVLDLRAKAVDLIKYENLQAYREHVMSAEFQADTLQLVKVDLPAIATAAAKRGADEVMQRATALAAEVEGYREKAIAFVHEKAPMSSERLEVLREKLMATGTCLASELQAEVSSSVEHIKVEGFSMIETLERLKRVIGVVDKHVVSPLIAMAKSGDVASVPCGAPSDGSEGAPTPSTKKEEKEADDTIDDAARVTKVVDIIQKSTPTPPSVDTRVQPSCPPRPPSSATDEDEMKDAIEDLESS